MPRSGHERNACTHSQQRRRQADQRGREPRGEIIGQVVDPGRRPAELPVAVVLMAEHRIQRVDRPIDHRPHGTGNRGEEQRGRHAVHGALGDAFHGRPDHARLVELLRVAADDRGHPAPGLDEVAGNQRTKDGHAVPGQVPRGDGRVDDEDRHRIGRPADAPRAPDESLPTLPGQPAVYVASAAKRPASSRCPQTRAATSASSQVASRPMPRTGCGSQRGSPRTRSRATAVRI